jgi:hypothetical protein
LGTTVRGTSDGGFFGPTKMTVAVGEAMTREVVNLPGISSVENSIPAVLNAAQIPVEKVPP